MFNSITGVLTYKGVSNIYLLCNNIEFDIQMPQTNVDALPPLSSECKIYTYLLHTDTLLQLYGFSSASEREIFCNLLKVEGIGPKSALKILSNISSDRLLHLLETEDINNLQKIGGIGKKGAGKLLLALKGKVLFTSPSETHAIKSTNPALTSYAPVITSLVNMGYDRATVEARFLTLYDKLKEDPAFTSLTQEEKEDSLFKSLI